MAHEVREGGYIVTDDRSRIAADEVHAYLVGSYWASGIPIDVVRRSMENSICFGVFESDAARPRLLGFGRVVSDRATFAWIGDVFVLEEFRGRGLSKLLMRAMRSHPELQLLRRWMLMTRDAQGLYRQFGFVHPDEPTRVMEIRNRDVYRRAESLGAPGRQA